MNEIAKSGLIQQDVQGGRMVAVAHHVTALLCLISTAVIAAWLWKYSAYGLDFTDDSFYIVWMENPYIYSFSTTQFGFIYHWLYVLLDGDIASLRRFNILTTLFLAWWFAYFFLSWLAPEAQTRRLSLFAAAAGIATSALILFDSWLPTPNYNGLALHALFITGIGAVLAERSHHLRSCTGWLLIGLGGWLAFMAKPSTAFALAIVLSIYLLMSKKFSLRLLLLSISTAVALLIVSALLIDGSVEAFARRVQLGIKYGQNLNGTNILQILRIDNFRFRVKDQLIAAAIAAVGLAGIWGIITAKPRGAFLAVAISICVLSLIAALASGAIHGTIGLGEFQGLSIFGVMLIAAVASFLFGGRRTLKEISSAQWSMAALFISMPYVYALGTNRNYWVNGSWAGIFILLAFVTLLGPIARARRNWAFVLPLASCTQAVAAVLLQTGLEQPPRQPQPLRLNDTIIEVGPRRSPLVLSSGFASYITDSVRIAQESGFPPGTPVIDLSGHSPGILFALGAKSIGQPWTLGGWPGTFEFAKASLDQVSCDEVAAAWLLLEPNGPNSIPTELISALGPNFPSGYQKVGDWQTAKGAAGFDRRRGQEFYKPTNPDAGREACRALRAGSAE